MYSALSFTLVRDAPQQTIFKNETTTHKLSIYILYIWFTEHGFDVYTADGENENSHALQ